jgi:hypothetical protein
LQRPHVGIGEVGVSTDDAVTAFSDVVVGVVVGEVSTWSSFSIVCAMMGS